VDDLINGGAPTSTPHEHEGGMRALLARYRISSLVAKTEEPGEALQGILTVLIEVFRASSGSIALINPDTGKLEIEVQHGLPLVEGDDLGLKMGQGITGWVAFHGKPLLVPDVLADPRYVRIRPQVMCEMAVPMLETIRVVEEASQVLGVINLDSDVANTFLLEDLRLFEQCAIEATAVMQRIWRLQLLRAKAHQLEILIGSGQALVGKLEERELLESVVLDARRIMHAKASAVYLHDPTRSQVYLAAWSAPEGFCLSSPEVNHRFHVDDCAISAALHTRKVVEFQNIQAPEYHDLPDIPQEPSLVSMLVTPMVLEGEVIGALTLFTERLHRFTNEEKRLCSALASIALVALQNARLYARVFQSEDSLRKNEQLTTLGLLAAEIAHEIRNPLTVIKLLFGYLGLEFPEGDPRRTDVRVIGEKLDQLEAIVTRVLNFAKAPSSVHSRWSVAEIIEDTIVLIRLKLSQSKIQLKFTAPGRSLLIDAHKGQIQQVLLNLLINATQAMHEGGSITVGLGTVEKEGNPYVTIDVTDTGSGIPEDMRDNVFESFLSGRPDGTGLGLAIAKRILRSHHGDISLVATGSSGTTMRILLPLVRP
jgi:signal transduction histidine kinase